MVQHKVTLIDKLKRVLEKDIEQGQFDDNEFSREFGDNYVFCTSCIEERKINEYEPHLCKDCKKAMCSHYAYLFNFATTSEYSMCLDCVMTSDRYIVQRLAESFTKIIKKCSNNL